MDLETRYNNRRKRLLRRIGTGAALIGASRVVTKSRDQSHPFRQDSNFFYLTGFCEPEAALLLLGGNRGLRTILFLRDRCPTHERYEGERLGLKRAKNRFHVDEIRNIDSLQRELPTLLKGKTQLHIAPGANPWIDSLAWHLFTSQADPTDNAPCCIKDVRLELHAMRAVKDHHEIQTIKHAADITVRAFLKLSPQIHTFKSEAHAAKRLEEYFTELGAENPGFSTIVASGKNATTLHHTPRLQPIWKRKTLLIDAGAEFRNYSADITRVLPVSGKFSAAESDIYNIVLAALQAASKKVKPGVTLKAIHAVAVKEITAGLIDIGIIKNKNLRDAIANESYKKHFMHRTSHFLGLDVHDPAPPVNLNSPGSKSSNSRPLVPGNLFTVEPGIYLDPKDTSVPKHYRGIGVRIEDDILVTSTSSSVITSRMPVSIDDIEALLQ